MRALLAGLPIALLLLLLLTARVRTAISAGAALTVALLLTPGPFPLVPPGGAMRLALAGVVAEGAFIAGTIVWILLPALAIHELQVERGGLAVLRAALSSAAPEQAGKALLIGWFFALFLEGAAGFGTPLAVAAPMLAAIGMPPVHAVAAALLGHSAGVAFGAVGTPVLAQVEIIPALSGMDLARYTALLVVAFGWIPAVYVLRTARGSLSPNRDRSRHLSTAALACAFFYVPFVALAVWTGPELPTLAGALLGGAAFVGYLKHRHAATAGPSDSSLRDLVRAAAPYLLLIALILLTRLVPDLKAAATAFELAWTLEGGFSGSVRPLYHPGTLLLASFVIGGVLQGARSAELARAMQRAARRLAPAIVALLAMLILSRVMLHAGMLDALAAAGVGAVGRAWPALAPAVGALGSFVTGSATASNILFTSLQYHAAESLALPAVIVLAAQGAGAALGNAICPHNIIAGAAAVGASGREGAILRRTLPVCALMLVVVGTVALLLAR